MEVIYYSFENEGYFSNRSFTSFYGEAKDLIGMTKNLQKSKVKPRIKVKKLIDDKYLEKLGLSNDILTKRVSELNREEASIVLLIHICLKKPSLVILNNFDLGFNYKDKSKVSRFIKEMNAEFKTNFVIISNDILFLNKCAKHLIICKNKIIKYQGDYITAIKQGLIPELPIISFIDMANKKEAKLTYTLDGRELLKDIYRSVF